MTATTTSTLTPSPPDTYSGGEPASATSDLSTFSGTTAALWPDVPPSTPLDYFGLGTAAATFSGLDVALAGLASGPATTATAGDRLWLVPDAGSGFSPLAAGFQQFPSAAPPPVPAPSPACSSAGAQLLGSGLGMGTSDGTLESLELLFEHPTGFQQFPPVPAPSPACSSAGIQLLGPGLGLGASDGALEGLELLFEHPAVWQEFERGFFYTPLKGGGPGLTTSLR